MVKKALLIGCNYVGTSAELKGCVNDVIHIKKFLKDEHAFNDSEIRIMTEASDNPENIPTKANILKALKWLVENNDSSSKLFLQYSGHGSQVRDLNGDETDGKDETICPIDFRTAGMIIDDQLRLILLEPLKEGAQLFFLCDACHSQSMCDTKYNYRINTATSSTTYTVVSDARYKQTVGNAIIVSGCLDSQTSADAYLPGINTVANEFQGALTYSFLKTYETLKKGGKPLTYKNLMKNLLVFIKQRRFTQIPQISSGRFMDLGAEIKLS